MVSVRSKNITSSQNDPNILGHRCSILGHFVKKKFFLGQKPYFRVFLGPLGDLF